MAQATLQSYLNETRRLLHDASGRYWTDVDLISAINQAQRRTVADSACLRRLQTIYLSAGLETFGPGAVSGCLITLGGTKYTVAPAVTFSAAPTGGTTAAGTAVIANGAVTSIAITTPGSGYLAAPTVTIAAPGGGGVTATATATIVDPSTLDVMNITILWGTMRVTLDRIPFTQFQAFMRAFPVAGQPRVCASYGQATWYVGQIPDQDYVSEWDTIIVPADLAAVTDQSPINYPYSDVVPFYAAHIAKFKEQSLNEADFFLAVYQRKMQHAIRSTMMRKLPSVYGN